MMKRIISIVFLVLYMVALTRPIAPLLDYLVRYDYFSKVLCVNKARPELKCNGQCVLMKKLQAMHAEEGKPISSLPASFKVNLDDYPVGFMATICCDNNIGTFYISYSLRWIDFYRDPVDRDLFRPPMS